MAKKKEEAVVIEAPKAKAPKAPTLEAVEARVTELEGDLLRLATLIGFTFGEPLASQAKEIAEKHQGAK